MVSDKACSGKQGCPEKAAQLVSAKAKCDKAKGECCMEKAKAAAQKAAQKADCKGKCDAKAQVVSDKACSGKQACDAKKAQTVSTQKKCDGAKGECCESKKACDKAKKAALPKEPCTGSKKSAGEVIGGRK